MTGRELAVTMLASRDVVEAFGRLGRPVSPRTMQGALSDAGRLTGYATVHDYRVALAGFVEQRLRHGRTPAIPR
jgi:hypothetical protein